MKEAVSSYSEIWNQHVFLRHERLKMEKEMATLSNIFA